MSEEVKQINIQCTSPILQKGTTVMQMNMAQGLAILQAVQFVIANKAQFQKEVSECELCFKKIEDTKEGLSEMIQIVLKTEEERKQHAN